ncbi:C-5 cytosine-specific DNA methylase [Colletotrichum navitas]|uniref:DNA (cytosine-5-)-methyltransferase n=1 Tax=Colletotrichum navitas TaxID=681940 RepID=A0AAD8PTE6_9PEZI|nr:C-5 cytosine-specific DNA methylase [Colletotrichum navitas]KAK1580211.1 C-5 cytosine-specific DNA methylase [Colletotrichum navitas]
MDNPNDCFPFDWEDPEFLLEPDDHEGLKNDLYGDLQSADSLSDYEERVTHQALEAPTALVTSDLCACIAPEPQDDAQQKAPIHEQTAWDGEGLQVGTILPTVPITLINQVSVDIPSSTLIIPRSLYQGETDEELYVKPAREWTAVQSLLEEYRRVHSSNSGDIEFDLDQFAVYIDATVPGGKCHEQRPYPCEMRPLQHLGTQFRCNRMYVDGILSVGNKQFSIRGIPFEELPIGNYGSSEPTIGSELWIRSCLSAAIAKRQNTNIYYRLKNPSTEYQRYHTGFVWVADLAKHVVDYLSTAQDKKQQVIFRDFRSAFYAWADKKHGNSESFCQWQRQYQRTDFCGAVAANLEFIWKEASGVLGHKVRSIYLRKLWKEIREFTAYSDCSDKTPSTPATTTPLASPSPTPSMRQSLHIPKTVVTPYINQLFDHLPCGLIMEALDLSPKTKRLRRDVTKALRLESALDIHTGTSAKNTNERSLKTSVNVGDVISTARDEGGNWEREIPAGFNDVDRWFGLVQKVHRHNNDKKSFDIIWMYRPVDTICGNMKYPWSNELFLSDHCSCNNPADKKIKEEEVLAAHKIDWGGSSAASAEFFCRQTYLHEDRRFITFQKGHLFCMHHSQSSEQEFPYKIGDTLLVCLKSSDSVVEPCELVELCNSKLALFRLLRRRQTIQSNSTNEKVPPNELVYSDELLPIGVKNIQSRCTVRFFRLGEPIPVPYDRKGVGNTFFIRYRWQSGQMIPLEDGFLSLRQGFDPAKPFPKLRGFDLFCGGGNFGRGLEEGGVIEMNWANDLNKKAIHTYMANTENTVYPFAGSIDDLQRLALQGKFSKKVPPIGSVDFVSGGSPCPGFSRLTNDKATPEQRKNQSLVAAFASFIDVYRPKFGLLENVMDIVQTKTKRNEDVLSQLICAIVGLGYQAHFFIMDSWAYGSPQSRSRVFLCFAAPGLKLPEVPVQSHSHYESGKRRKTLGWLPNGESMVERLEIPTPFKFVSIAEATADLPDIMDGKADCCVNFPDHRMAYSITRPARAQLSVIPMHPWGMNFRTTWDNGKGTMTTAERGLFPSKGERVLSPTSRAWGRAFPHSVMQTVTTTASPTDARIGRIMHWSQNRVLSVMEVRRAQGFLDHEVILGTPKEQWKVVGNSVSREVSLALGLSFREAWLGSLIDGEEVQPTVNVPPQQLLQAQAQAEAAPGNSDSGKNLAETDTLSIGSRGETPVLVSPRSQKRKLGSSFVIELVVSKMLKKQRGQATPERSEGSEDDESAEVTSALTSSSSGSSCEIIELD